jgi:PiT family inorganic phosphate transporter
VLLMLPLLVVSVVAALAFANGANDVSKGVAPLVGSGVAGYRSGIAWGTAWTAAGAVLGAAFAGAMLATFGKGLLAPGVAPGLGAAFAALFGAAAWVALATRTGLPVSTTHAIVGAIVGATMTSRGIDAIRWSTLGGKVVVPLLLSPVVAFILTAGLARLLRGDRASGAVVADCLCAEVIPVLALPARPGQAEALVSGVRLQLTRGPVAECAAHRPDAARATLGHLQWVSSAATSLSRGMNDAPKMVALGLAAAALGVGEVVSAPVLYSAVTAGMVVGGLVAGRRVTTLLAEKITVLDTTSGLAANGITALLVAAGAFYGLPMSTTHVAAGGLTGVGAMRGSVNWATVRQMALAWVVTLPASAALAGLAQAVAGVLGA